MAKIEGKGLEGPFLPMTQTCVLARYIQESLDFSILFLCVVKSGSKGRKREGNGESGCAMMMIIQWYDP